MSDEGWKSAAGTLDRAIELEHREVRQLYWDHVFYTKQPYWSCDVDEIAKAYGFANGKQMRRLVDLASDQGITCTDCNRVIKVHSRHEYRDYYEHPKRCKDCEAKARQRFFAARSKPAKWVGDTDPLVGAWVDTARLQMTEPKKEPPMSNVSTVMSGEAAVHTVRGGTEIELRLPPLSEGQEYSPMMKLLAAIVHRADEEPGWWEDQVRWFDAYMVRKRFAKTRMQLRLVTDNDKAPHK